MVGFDIDLPSKGFYVSKVETTEIFISDCNSG